jgi:hypothetical protein
LAVPMEPSDTTALELRDRVERLDRLIAEREDGVRGLGVRLALGLALERSKGVAPGAETGPLVAGWVERFGADAVDDAVQQARALLREPSRMAEELRRRLEPARREVSDA